MASSFSEQNGKWTFYAKVRQRSGFTSLKPARLWNSKEEAEMDVELFIWYSSIRGKDDPPVPLPHGQWFKTILPDDSWEEIRAYLAERGCKVYPSKKRLRGVVLDSYSKKARLNLEAKKKDDEEILNTGNKILEEVMEEMIMAELGELEKVEKVQEAVVVADQNSLGDLMANVCVMRKPFTDLSISRKKIVGKCVDGFIQRLWPVIAPGQDKLQQQQCLRSTFGFVDCEIRKNIEDAYKLAIDVKNEDKKTSILSMFVLQKNMTREKLSSIVGERVSGKKYLAARFHASVYGIGMEAEKTIDKRNVHRRKDIIDNFVKFCIGNGLITANGRTIKRNETEDVCVPNIKRLEGKQPLIRAFEEEARRLKSHQQDASNKRMYLSLRRKDMETVISVVCPEAHCSMEALDVVAQQHGVLNFKRLETKLSQLIIISNKRNGRI